MEPVVKQSPPRATRVDVACVRFALRGDPCLATLLSHERGALDEAKDDTYVLRLQDGSHLVLDRAVDWAPLSEFPECGICLENPARAFTLCKCTSPRLCFPCFRALGKVGGPNKACPVCRKPFTVDSCSGWPVASWVEPLPAFSRAGPEGQFSISIRSLTTSRPLRVAADWTAKQLAIAFAVRIGFPLEPIRLIFKGRGIFAPDVPDSDRTLADIGVQEDSTVHFVSRERGD